MPYGAKNGTVNGTDFVSFGRGEDALLLIPGLGDGLRTVKGMALSLSWLYREYAKAYRVYVFSRRNALPEGFTIRDMADDLRGAMDALGLRRADVLGVSQGGMIAQHLAAAYPEAVGRLALAVTAAWANPTVQAAAGRWAAWAESGDYGRIVTDTAERMYSEKTLRKYRPLYPILARTGRPRSLDRFLIQARACLGHDARGELGRIQCPTLVLGGARDRVVGDVSAELAGLIPGAERYVYPELGHGAYEEARDFNRRVLDFLTRGR